MGSTRGRESVSFVIIAFNEEANIARAIFAITGLEGLGDHEIIVVNDGSRDGTARVVRDIARRDPPCGSSIPGTTAAGAMPGVPA